MSVQIRFKDIQKAQNNIKATIHKTPVLSSAGINSISGTSILFKCENFQKAGAFKMRGATNAVNSLTYKQLINGVATHSSGNHAAALALAAKNRGVKAFVIMPENAPAIKKRAVREYDGLITYCKPSLQAREEALAALLQEKKAVEIHPYDNPLVIAGQGTAAAEFIDVAGELDLMLAPVGGGGLISGTAIATSCLSRSTKIIGVEPQLADDARRSIKAGKIIPSDYPPTIADGLRTSLCEQTFQIIQKYVDDIVTAQEATIINAMRLIWERMKIVVEPSAAVPLAAVLEHDLGRRYGKIGIILSGGNQDLDDLPWLK